MAAPPANSPTEWLEITKLSIQITGYVVTWAIVLFGWRVSNTQNKRRDERKELRDQISSVTDALREVESNVVSYLTDLEASRDSSYWTVHFGVHQVNSSVVLCKLFKTSDIDKLLRQYRQAITDKAMPGPTSVPPKGAELNSVLRSVSASSNALIRGLETRYRELYPFSAVQK